MQCLHRSRRHGVLGGRRARPGVGRRAGIGGQTYGFATLPPGTLNHTTASAISKVLKEKGGVNMLVQPTAGDQVINPMVGRGEVEIEITNIMEAQDALDGQLKDMRIITAVHALRTPFFVRKELPPSSRWPTSRASGRRSADCAMRNIEKTMLAQLATAGLTERRRQAGAGAQCGAQRRRIHGRQR